MANTDPVTTDAGTEAVDHTKKPEKTEFTVHPHPAAQGDAIYETRIFIDEKAEEKRKEAKAKMKKRQQSEDPDAEDEPVEMIEMKDRGTGDVVFVGPADAEWKKDDLGDPISYAERFGLETKATKAKAEATGTTADTGDPFEPADLNQNTVAELKAALDQAGVDYPSNASKAALIKLAEDNDVTVA